MNLKKYEKVLRDIIAGGGDLTDPVVREAIDYWDAEGCVDVVRAWGGAPAAVTVTPEGRAYFAKKKADAAARRKDRLQGYLWGVLTGVTVTVLVEKALPALLRLLSRS